MDHLAQAGIFVLEELRDAKEERRRFRGGELLARIEKKGDFCEENATSPRLDGRRVEETSCRPPSVLYLV
jgi:hypothetical protein